MLSLEKDEVGKVYMLLGLSNSSLMAETVPWLTIGAQTHIALRKLALRRSPLSDKLIISGSMGINPVLLIDKKQVQHLVSEREI